MNIFKNKNKAFTIIELIVIIAIIGVLASIVAVNVSNYLKKARDARRKTDLVEMQTALQLYWVDDNNSYPSTGAAQPTWRGTCSEWGSYSLSGSNGYIPNLAPTYMAQLPVDPKGYNGFSNDCRPTNACYLYTSDGVNYKILALCTPEIFSSNDPFNDPKRTTRAWMVCSGEPACSNW